MAKDMNLFHSVWMPEFQIFARRAAKHLRLCDCVRWKEERKKEWEKSSFYFGVSLLYSLYKQLLLFLLLLLHLRSFIIASVSSVWSFFWVIPFFFLRFLFRFFVLLNLIGWYFRSVFYLIQWEFQEYFLSVLVSDLMQFILSVNMHYVCDVRSICYLVFVFIFSFGF